MSVAERAVFLDRDGVIFEDRADYVKSPEEITLVPAAIQGIRLLIEAGFRTILVTNQSAIGRGIISDNALAKIHQRMLEVIEREKGIIHAIYFCPHRPEDECDCRKPKTALFLQAARDFSLDLGSCFLVGDSFSDLEAGSRLGCATILVRSGKGKETLRMIGEGPYPDFVAEDLLHAAQAIVSGQVPGRGPRPAVNLKRARKRTIQSSFAEHARTITLCSKELPQVMSEAVALIVQALSQGKKLLLFGNGGSAADAQHLAAEFIGGFQRAGPPLPAIALSGDTSVLTSVGNDFGFSEVFSRQVEALAQEGDIVIGISTSGNSENVLKGVERARSKGAKTIGLSGKDGGALAKVVDLAICAPSRDTRRIQEAHIVIGHIICEMVESRLAASRYRGHEKRNEEEISPHRPDQGQDLPPLPTPKQGRPSRLRRAG